MLQYHHRYICLLELEDYASVIRDTERNLALFNFIAAHTKSEDAAWSLLQFAPQCLMVHTRAAATQALKCNDYDLAIHEAEDGIEKIKAFYQESPHPEFAEQSREIESLQAWLDEIKMKRPLTRREQLERALFEAVKSEDYERAARVRDQLKKLEPTE
jgi:protein-arginine kinase activator protein McsA